MNRGQDIVHGHGQINMKCENIVQSMYMSYEKAGPAGSKSSD